MIWINKFKIAIIEESIKDIELLINEVPKFDSKEEINEVLALINEATKILNIKKSETLITMRKIKEAKKYLT
jgi:hypothetical protein